MQLKNCIVLLIICAVYSQPYPNVIFHGLGDSCDFAGMKNFTASIAQGTGTYTRCIHIGLEEIQSQVGVWMPFPFQVETSCRKVREDPNLQGVINVIGLSQGSLLARSIIEQCGIAGRVSKYLSIGGPQMGVMALPDCLSGTGCAIVNFVLDSLVYTPVGRWVSAPAGYFKDPRKYDEYLKESVYLPYLNNERTEKNSTYYEKMIALDAMMLVMFELDTVLYPRETAWFGYYDAQGNLLSMEETELYQQDYIGLQELNEANKITFVPIDGNHLQFTYQNIMDIFVPFLLE